MKQIEETLIQNTVPEMSKKHRQSNNIPKSRDEAKKRGIANKYIYSYGDFKRVLKSNCRLVKHAKKEYGITDLQDITKEMVDDYIQSKVDSGCSRNYIMTEKYATKKLDYSMLNTGRRSKHDPSIASTVKLSKYDSEPHGHYTAEEAKVILSDVKERSMSVFNVIEAQKEMGFRISEVLNAHVEDIDLQSKEFYTEGKGGKPRTVDIPDSYISKLESLIKDKKPSDLVYIGTGKRNAQKIVKNVCSKNDIKERGTHGFRGYAAHKKMRDKGYSSAEIDSLIKKHGNAMTQQEKNDLRDISRFLGHERIKIIKDHYLQR
ncbi:MAG: tyrosine-type recombinase/integrase [bacterium]